MLVTVHVKVSRNPASQRPQGGLRGHGSSDQEEAGIPLLALFPLIKRKVSAGSPRYLAAWAPAPCLSGLRLPVGPCDRVVRLGSFPERWEGACLGGPGGRSDLQPGRILSTSAALTKSTG